MNHNTTLTTTSRERLLALAKRLREQSAPSLINPETQTIKDDIKDAIAPDTLTETSSASERILNTSLPECPKGQIFDKYGNPITLNDKQNQFVELSVSGQSCVLIGAAGTGKTTCQQAVTTGLITSGKAGILQSLGHKHLQTGTPGIVICAYTRRAVANIRRNMPLDLQNNCITIHKLLEYAPVYYEVMDPETGDMKNKMCFEPSRGPGNPLPSTIRVIIFEESSMLGTELYEEVIAACPHNVQLIFLGDIQQLPPVFGPAILGFKLLELPVVELTEVYRQALESPIISLAHRILSAKPIPVGEYKDWNIPDKMTIRPWKKKIDALNALLTTGTVFKTFADEGIYDPEEDIILIPFNKSFGTDELNKIIANHLAKKRGETTYQIIAGFFKIYLSPGDKVLYDKEDATILKIETNPAYTGAQPIHPSKTLDYWGHDPVIQDIEDMDGGDPMDFLLAQTANAAKDGEERVRKCSHIITLQMNDSDTEVIIDTVGDVNSLLLGYALTVHKSQGSEWRKVFFVCHQSHATMLQRELLYTAVTRAREELYIICEPETFTNGILSQRVKGNTLEEKAEFFKGKAKDRLEKLS